jgi:cell division protein FtsA
MADGPRKIVGDTNPMRSGLVTALDVGTSKVACLIARIEDGAIRIVGSALRASRGMRAGTLVDLNATVEAIGECVNAAETMADTRVPGVIVSVNCGSPASVTARTAMTLDGTLVTDAHLRALLADGRARCTREGYEIIQASPTGYVVDEVRGVRDPSGMFCQQLGAQMHAVAVRPPPLANLRLAVDRCRLNVAAALFAGYASARSVLTDDERQLGATLIDMGGGCTSIAVYMEGHLAHVEVVPIGGVLVTNDLAQMLAAPWEEAERVKVLHGAALGDLEAGAADLVAVAQMGEEGEENAIKFPRSTLTRIIQARIEETFSEVQRRLRESGFDVAAGRRAVLTGGASQLGGVRELAGRILNKQVRLGKPSGFIGLPESAAGPDYACAAGLIIAGASMPPEQLNSEISSLSHETGTKGWLSRLTGALFG